MNQGFGRDTMAGGGGMTGMPTRPDNEKTSEMPENAGGFGGFMGNIKDTAQNYISEVSYATNFTVILQLIGVGVLLTFVSSLAAVLFIMRYEPLKILTNRD